MKGFWTSETGAVTTNWTTLSAGVVGLGIATAGIVETGVNAASSTLSDVIKCASDMHCEYDFTPHIYSQDFSDGSTDGWNGATLTSLKGTTGNAILLNAVNSEGAEQVSKTFDVPAAADLATFSLDAIALNALDSNEGPRIYLDGQLIAAGDADPDGSLGAASGADTLQWTFYDTPGVAVNLDSFVTTPWSIDDGYELESISTLSITVDNPADTLTLGFGAATNGANGEGAAFDNITFTPSAN